MMTFDTELRLDSVETYITSLTEGLADRTLSMVVLEDAIGGYSKPSKMPWLSYSIPAQNCHQGSKLRPLENSTCSKCYALKGRYVFPNVKQALIRRLELLAEDINLWTACHIILLSHKATAEKRWFRWHDAGDLQNMDHLKAITYIAQRCPKVRFWLPSREWKLVRQYLKEVGEFPSNLRVRLSSFFVGSRMGLPAELEGLVTTSTVGWSSSDRPAVTCEAGKRGGKCADCRLCWGSTPNIDYPLH